MYGLLNKLIAFAIDHRMRTSSVACSRTGTAWRVLSSFVREWQQSTMAWDRAGTWKGQDKNTTLYIVQYFATAYDGGARWQRQLGLENG